MGFLKNMFKRKPGGTFVGNALRGITNKVSGGLLGNGALMISQEEYDRKNPKKQDPNQSAWGKITETLKPIAVESATNTPQGQALIAEQKKLAIMDMLKQYWWVVLVPVVAIVYFIAKRKK